MHVNWSDVESGLPGGLHRETNTIGASGFGRDRRTGSTMLRGIFCRRLVLGWPAGMWRNF